MRATTTPSPPPTAHGDDHLDADANSRTNPHSNGHACANPHPNGNPGSYTDCEAHDRANTAPGRRGDG